MESRTSMGLYLGILIDFQNSKVHQFTPLLDKISKRIASWNHSKISQLSKMIIINSILIGAIMHQLAVFRIPTTITSKIDRMLASFFLKDNQAKGIHSKKRDIIHRTRGQEGLGICNTGGSLTKHY